MQNRTVLNYSRTETIVVVCMTVHKVAQEQNKRNGNRQADMRGHVWALDRWEILLCACGKRRFEGHEGHDACENIVLPVVYLIQLT